MKDTLNKSRKLNRIKRTVSISAMVLSLILLLGGCKANNFTRAEKRDFLKAARGVASDLLKKQYSGAKIDDIQPETDIAFDGSGFVLTEFASGHFSWQGQTYSFLVNTKTEQVYTSVYLAEIKEGLKDAVLHGLDIDASEAVVDGIRINYLPIKDGVEDEGIYVDSANVLPWRESAEELIREILRGTEEYTVSIDIQYKGEDLPSGITKQDAPFPALTSVKFYHIREEHGLCRRGSEGFSYAMIPCLSNEILELNYRQSSPGNYSYTRNRVMEQYGLYVVYNAYEKTMVDGVITRSVINEKDITFTVTEEYIALDCAKDNYVMYLFAADQEKAEKYCYFFYPCGGKKLEIRQGMWYDYEDRYVYSDSTYLKAPHKFFDYLSMENIIYTKEASEEPPILPQSTNSEYIY